MGRREFITVLAGAVAWSTVGRAQQQPRIGYLSPVTSSADAPRREAFLRGLAEHGYIEGRNILVEWRFADGVLGHLVPLAAELVRLGVKVIVAAGGGPVTRAVMDITNSIPVVMTNVEDPVGSKLIASLARPGGNVTGLTALVRDLSAKRLEVVKETLPNISRITVVWNPDFPGKDRELTETKTAAMSLGIHIQSLEVTSAGAITSAFEAALRERPEALIILPDPVTNTAAIQIAELALARRLATMFSQRAPVDGGGLVSYGPNYADLFRRAAAYVDKILKGAKPEDLPVEQPTKFELIINLKTAKALGLAIPPALLARADEVID
jgi:putative ABC transport system substrate-binding protein